MAGRNRHIRLGWQLGWSAGSPVGQNVKVGTVGRSGRVGRHRGTYDSWRADDWGRRSRNEGLLSGDVDLDCR